MNILHLADTHLGYSAYRKTTEEGVNQREMDIYAAFTQCIDYAVKQKPDLVLHAGDLFDSVRPTNRAITVALQQILRLSQERIPFVVISGNHETPKLKETGNIFSIFDHLEHVYPVYHNHYEPLTIRTKKETVRIHAIPQCHNPEEFELNLKKIQIHKTSDYNILLAHGAVAGIKEFKMNEFNELFIPVNNLHETFDYIALGHYHGYTKLQQNAFYAGSTEHLSFSEAHEQKGFLDITLGAQLKHRLIPLRVRGMIDVPPLQCSTLSIDQIMKQVKETVHAIDVRDRIIRLRLEHIPSHLQRGIDYHQIQGLLKNALHAEIKTTSLKPDAMTVKEGSQMTSLADEYEKFLGSQHYPEKELLRKLGLHYIHSIENRDEAL